MTLVSINDDARVGWQRADIVKEYERQGLVGSSVWRIVENKDYELSKGYPRYVNDALRTVALYCPFVFLSLHHTCVHVYFSMLHASVV